MVERYARNHVDPDAPSVMACGGAYAKTRYWKELRNNLTLLRKLIYLDRC